MSPLNISVKGEYALLALLDLATQRPGEPIKIASIARRQKIPQKFLELILAGLKQGGFVESRRGADGGYLLARSPENLYVGEVLRYMEGGRGNKGGLRRKPDSPFSELWRDVDSAVSNILDHRTFAEVARTWSDKQSKYIPNWDI
ncbi:MAG: Rrf2 family transcriptional regulator [Bryobacterales bacterium]|nr:Rrf2 family transcriptional regulator [Bryobacterales bacterium]